MTSLAPILEPDADAMLRHLQAVFGGAGDGLVELAWTDPETRRLTHAQMFATDRLHELAERAATLNRTPNCNVYIGAALRQSTASVSRRASDGDFHLATCAWADVDDDVVNEAVTRCRAAGLMPNLTVVTGRRPHVRAQLWWRLAAPCNDATELRALNGALASALGGDPTVVNPGRVLRLGGSVAWPAKPGRSLERTEVHLPQDGRPPRYTTARIIEAFGSRAPLLTPEAAHAPNREPKPAQTGEDPVQPVAPPPASVSPEPTDLAIGSNVSVEACIARIRAGDHWHDNLVRLTGHWIARGWSDAEILTAAEALTLPGYTVAQTRREVAAMIAGGRQKWGIENIAHEIGSEGAEAERPQIIDPRTWSGKPLPVRDWLVENWIPMHYLTALYGDGGIGKTLLAQQLLTSVATGRDWLGLPVRRLRAFGLLCEDHEDDLHINQDRINGAYWCDYRELGDLRLWPSVGFDNLLMTFDGKDSSKGQLTAFFARLLDEVKRFGARFVVLDTAADLFGGNENIRSQVRQFIANACGRIARETNGAVLLCAHPSLSGMASGSGSSGSTAWNNTVRSRLYLTQAKAEDGDEPDPDLRTLTRKKANYARAGESMTLRWSDGVMLPVAAPAEEDEAHVRRRVLDEIDRAWREGQPYSDMPQARTRYVLTLLPQRLGLTRGAVERAYLALLSSGEVRSDVHDRHRNLRGLRAIHHPTRDGGQR